MAQDKIFMTGKLQEYRDAFRWGVGCNMFPCFCVEMSSLTSPPTCPPTFPPTHPPHCRAVDSGGNGTISATELFQRLDQPVRCPLPHPCCIALHCMAWHACVLACPGSALPAQTVVLLCSVPT
jgi:hypothetical protein